MLGSTLATCSLASSTAVWRLGGEGGEKSQCMCAVPTLVPQKVILATRKFPGQPPAQFCIAPDANATEPGPTRFPLKAQLPGPLHTSFCVTSSSVVRSGARAAAGEQVVAPGDTACRTELV